MLLKMNEVKKNYYDICVLDDFSLKVQQKEIVCLIGPSGCGKTTVLNIISGLLVPSSGEVVNNSLRISYVFQEDRLLPWQNVYENISIVNKETSREKCLNLIRKVGLEGFESYYPAELSGGMRQRCSIARAFCYEGDLLLMDEPLKSLDYNLRINIIQYIIKLWDDIKNSIVFVTHEIDEALLLGDKILVLSNRPTKVIKEFSIKIPKQARHLSNPHLVKLRNNIINMLQIEDVSVNRLCCNKR